ncbi:serpin family protein [Glycomyces salinus]|uniref:serpin family protein n=1 Tax=Glycomyces salinus TaxID=980294 RepID=UPI0018EA700A|nr:serpin family protein [Glycomyces salinus]
MGTDGTTRIEKALSAEEITAANELTRRWLASRDDVPASASALGVWPLLTALASGAIGRTRTELTDAAGVDDARTERLAGALLGAAASTPDIRLALAVWAGAFITLDPDWIDRLPAEAIGALTGDAEADKRMVDRWAAEHTDGMIERMPIDLTEPVDLLLASALMVETTWGTSFTDADLDFRSGPWSELGPCRVLRVTVHDDVLRVTDRASVLTVPGSGDIDVLLALGREDLSPQQVVSELVDAAGDRDWGRSAAADLAVGERAPGVAVTEYRDGRPQQRPEVQIQTVRFSVSSDLDLLEDASVFGLVSASQEHEAEFTRLAAQRTYVSQARQSCTAVFSATGFKAAAVTAIGMTPTGAFVPATEYVHRRVSINFDRPFAYAARHRPSGLILVAGWVAEPELAD